MKPHEFQDAARQFRAGKTSLADFTDLMFSVPTSASSDDGHSQAVMLAEFVRRTPDTHKGNYGRVLIVAGSPGMAGAAALSGMAALRSGAGLVTVATDIRCQAIVANAHPALMTIGLPINQKNELAIDSLNELDRCVPRYDCIAVGPGLGRSGPTTRLVQDIVRNTTVPVVVDADGINSLNPEFAKDAIRQKIVLTPHPGELKRLMPEPTDDREQQKEFARGLSRAMQGVVVLKGHRTHISGLSVDLENPNGNPGMATAGSGDVLTGIVAAMLGQGLTPDAAAVLGCYVHGAAGDIAAKNLSQVAMLATDIIDALPSVFSS